MQVEVCRLGDFSRVRLFVIPWAIATRLLCPWDSPGKNTGVGCCTLLQESFPTQGSNPTSLMSPALAGASFTTRKPPRKLRISCNLNPMDGGAW